MERIARIALPTLPIAAEELRETPGRAGSCPNPEAATHLGGDPPGMGNRAANRPIHRYHRLGAQDRRVALFQPSIPDGNYLPNLGIMYLAGILLNRGYHVRVFDANLDGQAEEGIRRFAPAILGITCVTAALGSAVRMAQRLKRDLPELVVVLGGPHPTALPQETIERHEEIDFCFIGECERSFIEFCDRLFASGGDRYAVHSVPGMAWRGDKGEACVNRRLGYLSGNELDALPYPPWQLLPMERIFQQAAHGLFTRGRRILPVMTSRGCPNYCTFCSRVMGFNFRKRSVDSVLKEIQWLYDHWRTDEIYFEDDTFTQEPERAHAILDGIIALRLPIHIKFANGLRADKVDEALLTKMKRAGAYWIGFGIESGSPHTQELMKKKLDLALAADNVRLAKRLGFKVGSNCIIGYPGERREDVRESIDYFLRLPLDSFAVVPCVPFPGTTAWVKCSREGWLTQRARNYDNYWFEIFKVNPLIETPWLTAADMTKAIRSVYIRFYFLNPRRSWLVSRALARKTLHRIRNQSWLPLLRAAPVQIQRPSSR